ncbi:MAG: hypothetical protein IPO08_23125 [Xanthomonadales bacterium]|nr:hypothetical protein [Xanthomonadales bacterium]
MRRGAHGQARKVKGESIVTSEQNVTDFLAARDAAGITADCIASVAHPAGFIEHLNASDLSAIIANVNLYKDALEYLYEREFFTMGDLEEALDFVRPQV